MTISSLVRSAGPFPGNGVTVDFPFAYKVFSKNDVIVTRTLIATGIETTLVVDTDFTVALNADQDVSPGGIVTYNPLGVPMPATQKLMLTSGVSLLQTLALTVGGGFSPSAIMAALDRAIIGLQQVALTVSRGLVAAVSDTAPGPLPSAAARASSFLAFDASGNPIAATGLASAPVSVAMTPVVAAATLAAGRAALQCDGFTMLNGTLVPTVNAGALTITIKTKAGGDPSPTDPVTVLFRNSAAATGDYTPIVLTAATSFVISAGSTMGATNNIPFRLWLVAFNDAGTFRLGAVNCLIASATQANIMPLRDDILASSTAEGGLGAADSAQVIYTGVAVAAKPLRVIGYIDWSAGLAAVGTYGIVPTKVHLHSPGDSLPGQPVQSLTSATGAVATGTTVVPFDDTIPQNTEGDQYLSQAIVPTAAMNLLSEFIEFHGGHSASGTIFVSLYQDAVANALATGWQICTAASIASVAYEHKHLAGTGASTTLKVRAGGAAAGTLTFNGSGGGRIAGGVLASRLRVEEIMA